MKRLVLLLALVVPAPAAADEAADLCRQSIANGNQQSLADCVADYYKYLGIVSRYRPPAPAPMAPAQDSGYYALPADPPPIQNILPPTVRCQSVNAGMGTVQTICR